MQTPIVSVIVPIYNVAPYLKECLQSLVHQSYENLDIVLVDDGSSDESLEIALEFATSDSRIFVVSKPNGGLSSARNFGLEFIKTSALRNFFDSEFKGEKNIKIQSLTQTHSFTKAEKTISTQELKAHFTQIQSNFIKSDLTRINDFIIQELPTNALIHFVDSDDYLTKDCIEKCLKALQEGDLDIVAHNITHFYEDDKSFKQGAYLRLKQSSYNTGLELLTQNKLYSFYFSWQGLFKAGLLNRYALRFSEGIYHEDHDFGTLLFCLADKVAYTNEALYIYRQRTNSIITTQKNKAFPAKLPYFLEPLKKDFKDYKALRAYFKGYCFVKVGFNIWHFYTQKSLQSVEFKEKFKHFFIKSSLSYMKIFKAPLNPDTLGIKGLLRQISFPKITVFCEFFKDLHRQPKKIRYILHLKYLLKKDTK